MNRAMERRLPDDPQGALLSGGSSDGSDPGGNGMGRNSP